MARGQYDRAIAEFTVQLGLAAGSDRTHNDRGLAYLRKGEVGLALADFESAISINPGNVAARNNRGLVLAKEGKIDLAGLLLRKVRDEVFTKTGKQQEPFTYGSLPAQPFYFKRRRLLITMPCD
jgi:Flp pilus assembly protein TadD